MSRDKNHPPTAVQTAFPEEEEAAISSPIEKVEKGEWQSVNI